MCNTGQMSHHFAKGYAVGEENSWEENVGHDAKHKTESFSGPPNPLTGIILEKLLKYLLVS